MRVSKSLILGVTLAVVTGHLVALFGENARNYTLVGYRLREQHKLEEAIAAYQKAIQVDPNFTLTYIELGNALLALQKPQEAIAAYQKAIQR